MLLLGILIGSSLMATIAICAIFIGGGKDLIDYFKEQ